MVGVTGFEPAASTSQMSRATNCATPRLWLSFYHIIEGLASICRYLGVFDPHLLSFLYPLRGPSACTCRKLGCSLLRNDLYKRSKQNILPGDLMEDLPKSSKAVSEANLSSKAAAYCLF